MSSKFSLVVVIKNPSKGTITNTPIIAKVTAIPIPILSWSDDFFFAI
jgi:hypothetical protein